MEFSEIPNEGFHVITRLHRQDIEGHVGKDKAGLLSDEDIAYIASKMGDAYVEFGFWDDLEIITEEVLRQKEEEPDEN